MNIVIIGAGVVGHSLAEQLSTEAHRVSIVDRDRARLNAIGDKLDVLCVHGSAGSISVLKRAGITRADMMIAVTDVDEVNMVAGMVAVPNETIRVVDEVLPLVSVTVNWTA